MADEAERPSPPVTGGELGPSSQPAEEPEAPISDEVGPSQSTDRLLTATVFMIFSIGVGNTTSGAVALPAIGDHFRAGPADVGWIVVGYAGAFAVMTAVYGTLARRFGLARSLIAGVLLFTIGAVAAVAAVNLPMLIAARIVQGLGAGSFPTLSMALIARRMSGPARARALGLIVAAVGVGFAAGSLLGGLALEAFGWRGAVSLGIFVAPAALILWRLETRWDRLDPGAPLDLPGILLLGGVIACLVFLINRTPVLGLSTVVFAAAAGLAVSVALLTRHIRSHREGAFPFELVTDRRLWQLMLLGFIGQTAFLGTVVVMPVAGARVHELDGWLLGMLLVPMAVAIGILSPKNGLLVVRIGRLATTTLSLTLVSLGTLLLAVLGAGAPPIVVILGLVVVGSGFAFLNAPLANEVIRLFPVERRSVALGIYNVAFFLGSATGVAVTTAFLQAQLELPVFGDRTFPGYTTALLVIGAAPFGLALARWVRWPGRRGHASVG